MQKITEVQLFKQSIPRAWKECKQNNSLLVLRATVDRYVCPLLDPRNECACRQVRIEMVR